MKPAAPTTQFPPKLPSPQPPANESLEERIKRVEQRLIAREERLWRGIDSVTDRVKTTFTPSRLVAKWAWPAASAAAGVGALTWFVKAFT